MTTTYAAEIGTWRYEPPYDCYDMTDVDPAILASAESGVFALVAEDDEVIGFRSFGADG